MIMSTSRSLFARPIASLIVSSAALAAGAAYVPPAHAETKVVVTIKPIHALVAQVMSGVGTPALLVSGSASPHTYAMKPSDAKALSEANIFFRVSPQVEPFTERVVLSLPKSVRVVTLAEAYGVELLDKRRGDTFEAHEHETDDHGGDHHDDHDEHDHEDGAVRDGHVWLDPVNAKAMVEKITEVLVTASPKDAEKLKANAYRMLGEIDALQAAIAKELEPVKGKPFVVYHDAYQYFERRFGLKALGSITVSPDVQPSAKRLSEIRVKISELSASCVFAEPQFSSGIIANVIEGTSARSSTLDPEGITIAPGPNAYFDLMRSLANGFKSCLGQGS